MRLRWMGIAAVAVAATACLIAWGCQKDAQRDPAAPGPDYTNFQPPPLRMPAPEGAAAATAARPGGENAEVLAKSAALFRTLAADDVERALDAFEAHTQFDFLTRSDSYRAAPGAWACFFATTIVVVGNSLAPEPAVAYYNPFLDAAVVTRWRVAPDGEPEIAGASLRTGRELAQNALATGREIPQWMTIDESPPRALRRQFRDFMDTFSYEFPPQGQTSWVRFALTSPDTVKVVGEMVLVQAQSLYVLQNGGESPVRGVLRQFHTALAAGDTAELGRILPKDNPMSATALAALPAAFRVHLCPVHVMWDEGRAIVFVGDSRTLRFYGIARYEMRPTARLVSFAVFDLASDSPALVATAGGE